jgi:WD repeat-containing protein 26
LRNFSKAARQLGSSYGILFSTDKLHGQVAVVLHLFRINAISLFPDKMRRLAYEVIPHSTLHTKLKKKQKENISGESTSESTPYNLEDIPHQLEELAGLARALLNKLNEVPQFTDEAVDASIRLFETDLKVSYWITIVS